MKLHPIATRLVLGLLGSALFVGAAVTWIDHLPKWLATPVSSHWSPDGRHRLDILQAFSVTDDDLGFARLFDAPSGAFMCESRVEQVPPNPGIRWASAPYNKVSVGQHIHLALSDDGTICAARKRIDDPAPVPPPPPPRPAEPLPGRIGVDRPYEESTQLTPDHPPGEPSRNP